MVMVTHEAHAATFADRILFLADGQIVKDLGAADEQQILETVKDVTLTCFASRSAGSRDASSAPS